MNTRNKAFVFGAISTLLFGVLTIVYTSPFNNLNSIRAGATGYQIDATHEFYAVADEVNVTSPETEPKDLENNYVLSSESGEVSIEFPLYFGTETTTNLYALISESDRCERPFSTQYSFSINGEEKTTDASILPGSSLMNFSSINLGEFTFSQGVNTIVFTTDASTYETIVFAFRAIQFQTTNDISFAVRNEFKAIDENTVVTGNTKNTKEDCVGSKSNTLVSIEFPLHLSESTRTLISVIISSNSKVYDFTTPYTFYINDVVQTTSAKTPQGAMWGDYTEIELGHYDLTAGTNSIEFTIEYGSGCGFSPFNFRSLILTLNSEVVFAETECESKCTICGGCMDFECTHDVCATKCSCVESVYDAIDDNTKVENGSKNTTENCVGVNKGNKVIILFKIQSSVATDARISFTVCSASSVNTPYIIYPSADTTDVAPYHFYINDIEQYSESRNVVATASGNIRFNEYHTIVLGQYSLVEGENFFKITTEYYNGCGFTNINFRSIHIATSAEVTLTSLDANA